MAGKQVGGESLPANLAGMTKSQLYEIMCQMKTLIDQNQQQARQILIQNPLLTKALFQAQIMLGMVQSPQAIPKIEPHMSQQNQPPLQPSMQSTVQPPRSLPSEQQLASQGQSTVRKTNVQQPPLSISSPSPPVAAVQSQHMLSHPSQPLQQRQSHLNAPVTSMPLSHTSQAQNVQLPHQSQISASSALLQNPVHSSAHSQAPLQQPLPSKVRSSSMPTYHHQYGSQTGANVGFQHHGGPQQFSQPMFHSGARTSTGSTFPHGQLPPQSMYQGGGPHVVGDLKQPGVPMVPERGSSWMPGAPESSTIAQIQGPPSGPQGLMGLGQQPLRPASLTPEMEKALLQQVMSLTPEQINLLSPEQRNQVLQLQQILRQ